MVCSRASGCLSICHEFDSLDARAMRFVVVITTFFVIIVIVLIRLTLYCGLLFFKYVIVLITCN